MEFYRAMAAIAREALAGEHATCLIAARALKAELLVQLDTDPSELGWARYYELRSLYFLGRYAECLAQLDASEARPATMRSDNATWLATVEAEMAASLRDVDRASASIQKAIGMYLRDQDLTGAIRAVTRASEVLARAGAPDRFGDVLDLLDRTLEQARPGSEHADRVVALITEIERSPWGRVERRRGKRGLGLALREAVFRADLPQVERLLAMGADPDALDGAAGGLSRPLLTAACLGLERIVRRLLHAGARPSRLSVQGRTALHLAADQGHANVVGLLIAAGAPLEVEDPFGQTPLHLASWHNHHAAVLMLLAGGANPNARDATGCTPLHLAAAEPNAEVLRVLIEAGGDLDVRDFDDCTPLMHAAAEGRAACAELLVGVGARQELLDERGRSAADYAMSNGHPQLGRRLYCGPRLVSLEGSSGIRSLC